MYKKVSKEIALILVMTAFLTVLSSAVQLSHAQTNTDLENAMLNIHNQERAAVGFPPLTWSNSLAADSQSWANHLTTLGSYAIPRDQPNPYAMLLLTVLKTRTLLLGSRISIHRRNLPSCGPTKRSKYNAGQRSGVRHRSLHCDGLAEHS